LPIGTDSDLHFIALGCARFLLVTFPTSDNLWDTVSR
jgi:hypothetical protein